MKKSTINILLESDEMELLLEGKVVNIDLNIKIDSALLKKHLQIPEKEKSDERLGKATGHPNSKKNRRST